MYKLLLSAVVFFLFQPIRAQQPVLNVNDKDSSKIKLRTLKINVSVVGNIATTTMEMEFCNNGDRVLEGELTFPMPEGVSISRYALDMNGHLREAVPVEKEKGQVVFENVIRKKVDPGLLEKLEGNNFRTRIYPLPAKGCRTIIIAYDQPLFANNKNEFSYSLPLQFRKEIENFSVDFNVYSKHEPEIGKSCNTDLKFMSGKNVFHAAVAETNFKPNGAFQINIPNWSDATPLMQLINGKYYFLINHFPEYQKIEKKLPTSLHIVWDNSFSGLNRDHKKEIDFIKAYCNKIQNGTITLSTIGFTFHTVNTYTISAGKCDELITGLNHMVYDGATNLSLLQWNVKADENLLFSDGINTYGHFQGIQFPDNTLHTVTASPTANFSNLRYLANRTGGQLINLNTESTENAIKSVTNQVFRLINVKTNNAVSEVYPSFAIVKGNVAVSGISTNANTSLTLQYGFGNTVSFEEKIDLKFAENEIKDARLDKIWAQQKITQLDEQYEVFKTMITDLGKKYSIVTRNTSLIVLDDIADYIKYEIEPPADLKPVYDSILREKAELAKQQFNNSLENARNLWTELGSWWDTDFVPKINGYVVDAYTGERVNNVKVQIRQQTDVTNGRGEFEIPNPTDSEMEISCAGYHTQTLKVDPFYGTDYVISLVSLKPPPITDKNRPGVKTAKLIKMERDRSKVSGIIVNAVTDEPIPSASVLVKNSRTGVATAADGSFQLNTTSKFLNVQVSSVGFDIGEVNLLQGGKYRIALKPSAKTLSEVVVRGYGSQSLDSVRADQYASALYANADHLQSKSIALNDSKDETREYKSDDAQKNLSGAISGSTLNYSAPAAVSTGTFATTDVLHISNLQVGVNHRSNNTNIEIKEIASNKPFIKILKETAATARYEKYLELRKNYLYTPGFYFDVARFFFTQHDKKTGLQILSTIADLNLEDYELYKMLGYELKIQGEFEEEINVFKKVLDWRPQEPQSYRDYGLALADAGKYQAAVDSLYTAITKNYDSDKSGDFNGIEEIIVTEINNIIALHKNVNTSKIDNDLIRPMPVDVRVVLNWNMNDTDMDLWVTDPRNEKCFYGNHVTKTGGRISDDFTSGYGPEHFMLKKAMKGTYKVQLHFFGESVQKISGGTTVLAEIYTHYGKPNQERKLITLQMEKDEEKEGILVGEFSF